MSRRQPRTNRTYTLLPSASPFWSLRVNNAGATRRGDFLSLSDEDWQDGFALKFFGAMRLIRAAWPQLQKRQGSIVSIIGVGGRTGMAEFAIGEIGRAHV